MLWAKTKVDKEIIKGPFTLVGQLVGEDVSEEVTVAETWVMGELETIKGLTFPSGWNQNFTWSARSFEICSLINSLASSLSLVDIAQTLLKSISY